LDESTRTLLDIRLTKAKEDLTTAQENLAAGRLRAAVNRAYYAAYHVTTALLLTKDIIRSKHAGVQAAFSQHFVKTGLIEPEYARVLAGVRKAREDSDYSDRSELDEPAARAIIAEAGRFVARIEQYLKSIGAFG
jgi:uncharacterized protein (UPF0332 family)